MIAVISCIITFICCIVIFLNEEKRIKLLKRGLKQEDEANVKLFTENAELKKKILNITLEHDKALNDLQKAKTEANRQPTRTIKDLKSVINCACQSYEDENECKIQKVSVHSDGDIRIEV